ncbi:hypothetical protein ZWY2020_027806 [Hordeum vulgare]|nr:hypothetical protein ZWY2020_027806 [Hordeum vulgare]
MEVAAATGLRPFTAPLGATRRAGTGGGVDLYMGFDDADAGGDEVEACGAEAYNFPFCGVDFDFVGLCCHINDEHDVEAKSRDSFVLYRLFNKEDEETPAPVSEPPSMSSPANLLLQAIDDMAIAPISESIGLAALRMQAEAPRSRGGGGGDDNAADGEDVPSSASAAAASTSPTRRRRGSTGGVEAPMPTFSMEVFDNEVVPSLLKHRPILRVMPRSSPSALQPTSISSSHFQAVRVPPILGDFDAFSGTQLGTFGAFMTKRQLVVLCSGILNNLCASSVI